MKNFNFNDLYEGIVNVKKINITHMEYFWFHILVYVCGPKYYRYEKNSDFLKKDCTK